MTSDWLQLAVILVTIVTAPSVTGDTTCVCLKEIVTTGSLHSPVFLLQNGTHGFLVAEQNGKIHSYTSSWEKNVKLFLDLQDEVALNLQNPSDERGLLSFALHPDYHVNRKLYTYSIRTYYGQDHAVISEMLEREGQADLSTEKVLLAIRQVSPKRNGGSLLFGPHGYLYISVGDGGAPDMGNEQKAVQAQDGQSLLGKILRVDPDSRSVERDILRYFSVPADNPFVGNETFRPEIYAYGFRNMFRCSIDQGSEGKEIYCGDTGNNDQEEINIIQSGGNYGWHKKEGNVCLSPGNCQLENEVLPIYTYNQSATLMAVIGGYVYRGQSFPDWAGHYIFGDISGGLMRLVNVSGQFERHNISICPKTACPSDAQAEYHDYLRSLSQDNNGELYLMMMSVGTSSPSMAVLKLVPKSTTPVTGDTAAMASQWSVTLMLACLFILVIKNF